MACVVHTTVPHPDRIATVRWPLCRLLGSGGRDPGCLGRVRWAVVCDHDESAVAGGHVSAFAHLRRNGQVNGAKQVVSLPGRAWKALRSQGPSERARDAILRERSERPSRGPPMQVALRDGFGLARFDCARVLRADAVPTESDVRRCLR